MKSSRKLVLFVLVMLLAGSITGLVLTRTPPENSNAGGEKPVGAEPALDQWPLETAEKLGRLATTPQEQQLARDAVRLADHQADIAYASLLRAANEQSAPQSAETRALQGRIQRAQSKIQADQERVKRLTSQTGSKRAKNETELQLAQAELALDEDELADAQEDLARSGGDERSRLQRLWERHQAVQHPNGTPQVNSSAPSGSEEVFSPNSLLGLWRSWSELRGRRAQLLKARDSALAEASTLSREHDALGERVTQEHAGKQQERGNAEPSLTAQARAQAEGEQASENVTALISSLHHLSHDEKNLTDLDRRIQDLRELASTYTQWSALVASAERGYLHAMIRSSVWMLLTVLALFVTGTLIEHLMGRLSLERKQQLTLRAVVRFAVQVTAVFVIIFVVLGSPKQMPTILGLAGAGLTVALKDFIVSFFGWFVLMGRNGIRVGDWVEINGVRGEVIDIGLLRTVLLETGNWTEAGHPTGRQVAFPNSFAVEGYYFNFSTSGQWLWDEFRVFIPSGENPYALIEQIRVIATNETDENARMAEPEWQRLTRRYGLRTVSAAPSVDVRITDPGLEVVVRYVTRANERSEVRSRLNHAIIKLLHRGTLAESAEPAPTVS